jgi:tetratricopeptide (TPR) repeat protein
VRVPARPPKWVKTTLSETVTEQANKSTKVTRLRRLCQLLAVAGLIWAVVAVVRVLLPPTHLTLAREAVASGQFDVAVERYKLYLLKHPEDGDARAELGLVLAEFDRPGALVEFRKVPPESESYLDALRQIVGICIATERFEEAEKVLTELTQESSADWWPQLTLAELHFRQSRPRDALPYVKRAIELHPQHAGAHFLLAEILDDLKRSLEMIEPLETMLTLEPENYAAHLNLAYAYAESGDSEKSGREARWCLARNPADVPARRFLAMAERAAGNLDQAMREVQTALQVAANDVDCRLLEAELLLFEEKPGEALQRLEPLFQKHSDDRRLVALLARASAASGNQEQAAEYRKQVQKLSSP